ncbi:hypothetical protein [Dyadobacter frigoris]|uniref:Uncharacterized protein n=1 Tax=Dyadobacter frigoris TaxID=2576211 RepID=A0A4U6CLT5_9BACT|nr:hypothetical protein [Dyadobacter frigoris]TKT85252.1 hypothetical protein FDK13_34230 [Dyadobacter frigoris]
MDRKQQAILDMQERMAKLVSTPSPTTAPAPQPSPPKPEIAPEQVRYVGPSAPVKPYSPPVAVKAPVVQLRPEVVRKPVASVIEKAPLVINYRAVVSWLVFLIVVGVAVFEIYLFALK